MQAAKERQKALVYLDIYIYSTSESGMYTYMHIFHQRVDGVKNEVMQAAKKQQKALVEILENPAFL